MALEVGVDEPTETIEAITLCEEGEVSARFEMPVSRPKPLELALFDGSGSWCAEGDDIVEYYWDFDDCTVSRTSDSEAWHSFPHEGIFEVRLVVTTKRGLQAEIHRVVCVERD